MIRVTWIGGGWMIIVAAPRFDIDIVLNRFNHFQVDRIPFVSHIDWFVITTHDIHHVPVRVARNAGWI